MFGKKRVVAKTTKAVKPVVKKATVRLAAAKIAANGGKRTPLAVKPATKAPVKKAVARVVKTTKPAVKKAVKPVKTGRKSVKR